MTQFSRLEDDAGVRRLLHVAAIMLVVIPFLQAGQQIWPLQLSNITWRYLAANALSSILLLPFVGLTLSLTLARLSGSLGVARFIGAVSSLFVIGLLGSLVGFALDALQLKTVVNSQAMTQFETTSVRVVLVTLTFAVTFSILMITAFRSSGGKTSSAKKGVKKAEEGVGLIVGQTN